MQKRKGEGEVVVIGLVVTTAVFVVAAFDVGRAAGRKQGVLDHADGKVVVVDLPDGRREVCEVKHGN